MKIHFIALGGSVMHSLAIAMKAAGHQVTGSDDQIYDPARSRLETSGLLPAQEGWDPGKITADLDAIILGMHAFADNPELLKAQELGIPIYSYPEFILLQSQHKQRIVVAGSYGKTTVTAMIMHVLKKAGKTFDYLVGAAVEGFDNTVRLTEEANVIVIEGDEYLASRLDPRPKFLLYQPHILVLTGISWDHINVFPTEADYHKPFIDLLHGLKKATDIVYNKKDKWLAKWVDDLTNDTYYYHAFQLPRHSMKQGVWYVELEGKKQAVYVIGEHNMANIASAWKVCELQAIPLNDFLAHIATFRGAQKRLEKVHESESLRIFRDYAHAPEKVSATVDAVVQTYKKSKVLACLELHTFSSLNADFLPLYQKSLSKADECMVFVDPAQYQRRRMDPLSDELIRTAFGDKRVRLIEDPELLLQALKEFKDQEPAGAVLLMMSSGQFAGLDLNRIVGEQ